MRLAEQKHEIDMRKKVLEIQMEHMAFQQLEEDPRQRFAAAKKMRLKLYIIVHCLVII